MAAKFAATWKDISTQKFGRLKVEVQISGFSNVNFEPCSQGPFKRHRHAPKISNKCHHYEEHYRNREKIIRIFYMVSQLFLLNGLFISTSLLGMYPNLFKLLHNFILVNNYLTNTESFSRLLQSKSPPCPS